MNGRGYCELASDTPGMSATRFFPEGEVQCRDDVFPALDYRAAVGFPSLCNPG